MKQIKKLSLSILSLLLASCNTNTSASVIEESSQASQSASEEASSSESSSEEALETTTIKDFDEKTAGNKYKLTVQITSISKDSITIEDLTGGMIVSLVDSSYEIGVGYIVELKVWKDGEDVKASIISVLSTPSNEFSEEEIELMTGYFGFNFPYISNKEYFLEDYFDTEDYFAYCIVDATEDDFTYFKEELAKNAEYDYYVEDELYEDIYWYYYHTDNYEFSVAYYSCQLYEGDSTYYDIIDLYAFEIGSDKEELSELVNYYFDIEFIYPEHEDYWSYDDYYDSYGVIEFYMKASETQFDDYYLLLCESLAFKESTEENGITYYLFDDNGVTIQLSYETKEIFTDEDYEECEAIDVYVYIEEEKYNTLTLDSSSLELGDYPATTASKDIDGITFEWSKVGDYGYGMQFKANYGTIYNTTPMKGLTELYFTTTNGTGKKVIDPALYIELSNHSDFSDGFSYYLEIENGEGEYSTSLSDYAYIRISSAASSVLYFESFEIVYEKETSDPDNIISNKDKGLPEGTNGIYNVDFRTAKYTKTSDLESYFDALPVGDHKVLVIPVEFSDITAESKGYTIEAIKNAFLPQEETQASNPYYSVYDYYYTSSYGKLNLDITVLDEWFKPEHKSSYYQNITNDKYNTNIGTAVIMDEALAYLDSKGWNLADYDANEDGYIDSVILINVLDEDYDDETLYHWDYQFYNYHVDEDENLYAYDDVSADIFVWAEYESLYLDTWGFDGEEPVNNYTFIHEFAHVLGVEDYYGEDDPIYNGIDVMDSTLMDHNPFTKIICGWIDNSKLVTGECEITIKPLVESGDTIILSNNFDEELGAFQEYFIISYYKNESLNGFDSNSFEDGIVIYHVNASLDTDEYLYYLNTEAEGDNDYLIETINNGDSAIYKVGDSLSIDTKDHYGNRISFIFTVTSIDENGATLTFTENK